jgi:putative salt-induced outer membrane protein
MIRVVLVAGLLSAGLVAGAQADGWKGVGELGFALSRGNSRSENLNARLAFDFEDETWKHNVYALALRTKGEVSVVEVIPGSSPVRTQTVDRLQLSANRYEVGASSGYKLSELSYLAGSLRYENDDFAPYQNQLTVAASYGRYLIKSEQTELNFEIGPGFRRAKLLNGDNDSSFIVRGLVNYKTQLTETTQLFDTLLIERGSDNTFLQNDLGVAVKVSDALALKTAFQLRRNSDVPVGIEKTDKLLTTNLVYNF